LGYRKHSIKLSFQASKGCEIWAIKNPPKRVRGGWCGRWGVLLASLEELLFNEGPFFS
jgi:hypothetical protein